MTAKKAFDTSWFDIENYSGLTTKKGNKELKLWYRQLCIRRYILDGLQDNPEWNEIDRQHRRKDAAEWLAHIETKPIFDEGFDNFLIGFQSCYGFSSITPPSHTFDQTTVASTKAGAFYNDWTEFKEKATLTLKQNFNLTDKVGTKSSDGRQWYSIDYYLDNIAMNGHLRALGRDMKGQFTYVTVDLTATNRQIRADFKQWLEAYRETTGYMPHKKLRGKATTKKSPKFNESEIKSWRYSKLLPYIDLYLVALAEGRDISDVRYEDIVGLFYPKEYEDYLDNGMDGDAKQERIIKNLTDKIRQTTAPKALLLLSDEILTAINRQLTE
ncbi:MAG: DUF6387 family protein [Methylovulum sp.]|nr:DUF6387 family protein [Methylovulum sp.]